MMHRLDRFRNPARKAAAAAGCALALFAVSCFDDRVAGNGSEVENAIVLGRVTLPSSEPAAGARLQLLPEDHDARKDAPPGGTSVGVSEKDGSFRLRARPGTYNVYAVDAKSGYRLLISKVKLSDGSQHDAGTRRLQSPGSIRLALPSRAKAGDYVYLPGTPLSTRIDSSRVASGFVQVDSVPTGRIDRVVLASDRPEADSVSGLGNDVAVAPSRVTHLPYTDWRHEGLVAIRARLALGGLAADVVDIPLLLRLDSANFDFSQAAAGGTDLRFTRDDGKPLAWHIQEWNAAARRARVWVRVDTVFAESTVQKLRVYWGAPDTAKPAAGGGPKVFAPEAGWVGAWHFDSRPSGAPAHFPDAGARGIRALAMGALATADSVAASDSGVGVHPAHGVLGSGLHLNGTDAWLSLEDTVATPTGFTLSFWFRTTTREGGKIAGFVMPDLNGKVEGRPGNFNFDKVIWMTDDGRLRAGFTMASADTGVVGTWQPFNTGKAYNDGQWHHVTYSLSDEAFYLYVDGRKMVGYTGPIKPLTTHRGYWRLGYLGEGKWDPVWTSEHFRGSLDEVRLIHAPRHEEWIRMDQLAQEPGSRLLELERR